MPRAINNNGEESSCGHLIPQSAPKKRNYTAWETDVSGTDLLSSDRRIIEFLTSNDGSQLELYLGLVENPTIKTKRSDVIQNVYQHFLDKGIDYRTSEDIRKRLHKLIMVEYTTALKIKHDAPSNQNVENEVVCKCKHFYEFEPIIGNKILDLNILKKRSKMPIRSSAQLAGSVMDSSSGNNNSNNNNNGMIFSSSSATTNVTPSHQLVLPTTPQSPSHNTNPNQFVFVRTPISDLDQYQRPLQISNTSSSSSHNNKRTIAPRVTPMAMEDPNTDMATQSTTKRARVSETPYPSSVSTNALALVNTDITGNGDSSSKNDIDIAQLSQILTIAESSDERTRLAEIALEVAKLNAETSIKMQERGVNLETLKVMKETLKTMKEADCQQQDINDYARFIISKTIDIT